MARRSCAARSSPSPPPRSPLPARPCPDSDDSAAGAEGSLAGICPETVVMQTDWNPQASTAGSTVLIGDDYEIDTDAVAVRGPLTASGVDTGVTLEIRSGGPAIGYQTVTFADLRRRFDPARLRLHRRGDPERQRVPHRRRLLGHGQEPADHPVGSREIYPDVHEIADLKETGASIHYFSGGAYMDYFVQSGIFDAAGARRLRRHARPVRGRRRCRRPAGLRRPSRTSSSTSTKAG